MTSRVGIDVGGTFTDFLLMQAQGRTWVHKELSTPSDPSLAVMSGLAALAGLRAMLATRGFRDALEMRRGVREEMCRPRQQELQPPFLTIVKARLIKQTIVWFMAAITAKAAPARAPRADNRLPAVLDAAARLFAGRGYSATSMRDIAQAVRMLPGSLYYHFAAKEDLLVAVYEAGVRAIAEAAQAAAGREKEPWARLEAACAAHLETVLERSDYAQVLIRVLPQDVPAVAARLRALRAQYERVFRELVGALPLPGRTDRRIVRLLLLGALNWSRFWFDPAGGETPKSLARKFIALLKEPQDA